MKEDETIARISAGLYVIKNPMESINLMVDKAGLAATKCKSSLNKKNRNIY